MTDWVRLWHDMPTDPKWRVIARKSGQPLACVIAVFTMMLTNASGNSDARGVLLGWDHEDAGAALDMDAEDVAAIHAAMQGKVLDGDRLTGWERRQVECAQGSIGRGAKSYLYVIANSASREVKIGTSRNPWSRAKDLQTGATGKTTVVATFSGIRSDETDAHRLLSQFRKAGEWFDLPSEIYAAITQAHDDKLSASQLVERLRSQLGGDYGSYEDTDKRREDSSEAKASGATPSSQSPDAKFWADAKSYLSSAGVKNPGAVVGKWVRDHGKRETASAVSRAQIERAVEPVGFVQACFREARRNAEEVPLC